MIGWGKYFEIYVEWEFGLDNSYKMYFFGVWMVYLDLIWCNMFIDSGKMFLRELNFECLRYCIVKCYLDNLGY